MGAADLDPDSQLGSLYLGSLLRAQLGLALKILGALVVTVGSWPLVFALAPGLTRVDLLGIPLPWVVLGGLVYPVLLGLGWVYVRRAERHERDFAELMRELGP